MGRRDQARIDALARGLGPVVRVWFRPSLRGLERLPPAPCLLVGNHSACGLAEIACGLALWNERFGSARPIFGLAHDLGFALPGLRELVPVLGGIRATRENALAALRRGFDVLVYPGGDLDALRPFHQPREVHFGARRGYARVAKEAKVPVVPLATIGSHWTLPMAPGGAHVARLLPKSARVERAPLPIPWLTSFALSTLTAAGLVSPAVGVPLALAALVPIPARITSELLEPIVPEGDIEEIHARAHGALARAVKVMRH